MLLLLGVWFLTSEEKNLVVNLFEDPPRSLADKGLLDPCGIKPLVLLFLNSECLILAESFKSLPISIPLDTFLALFASYNCLK